MCVDLPIEQGIRGDGVNRQPGDSNRSAIRQRHRKRRNEQRKCRRRAKSTNQSLARVSRIVLVVAVVFPLLVPAPVRVVSPPPPPVPFILPSGPACSSGIRRCSRRPCRGLRHLCLSSVSILMRPSARGGGTRGRNRGLWRRRLAMVPGGTRHRGQWRQGNLGAGGAVRTVEVEECFPKGGGLAH